MPAAKAKKPKEVVHPPSSGLTLTKDQDRALVAIRKWLRDAKAHWMFTLAGYAGTGKTTIMGLLLEDLPPDVVFCAPTGKAASVLQATLQKKDKRIVVRTVHQVLYQPSGDQLKKLEALEAELAAARADDKPVTDLLLKIKMERSRLAQLKPKFTVRPSPLLTPKMLAIVDEASMVSEKMRMDFENTGCRVLFVGDPGQLPPVKDTSWFIDYEHDAMLDTVMRQALDSPIIRLSMEVRSGKVDLAQYAEIIMKKDKVEIEEWMKADQVLTGSNASRRRINRFFRKQLGRSRQELPVEGDKMICLKNDHYKLPPWINGVQFKATEDCMAYEDTHLTCDYGEIDQQLPFYEFHCLSHYRDGLEEEPREMRRGLFEADYAYAVTVHKAQGSEWPFVILADDGFAKDRGEERKRWLYTGITRAQSRLLLIQ